MSELCLWYAPVTFAPSLRFVSLCSPTSLLLTFASLLLCFAFNDRLSSMNNVPWERNPKQTKQTLLSLEMLIHCLTISLTLSLSPLTCSSSIHIDKRWDSGHSSRNSPFAHCYLDRLTVSEQSVFKSIQIFLVLCCSNWISFSLSKLPI